MLRGLVILPVVPPFVFIQGMPRMESRRRLNSFFLGESSRSRVRALCARRQASSASECVSTLSGDVGDIHRLRGLQRARAPEYGARSTQVFRVTDPSNPLSPRNVYE